MSLDSSLALIGAFANYNLGSLSSNILTSATSRAERKQGLVVNATLFTPSHSQAFRWSCWSASCIRMRFCRSIQGVRIRASPSHSKQSRTYSFDHSGLLDNLRRGPILVNGWNLELWELGPEGSLTPICSLSGRHQKLLKPGETYTLLWPGCRIALWESATVRELIGRELDDKEQSLISPGGPHVTSTTYVEVEP